MKVSGEVLGRWVTRLLGLGFIAFGFAAWKVTREGSGLVEIVSFEGFGLKDALGIRLNPVTVLLGLMVTALGAAVSHYSKRYLSGEKGQARFFVFLLGTVLSVLFLITANHFVTLFLAWMGASLCLHQLLVFFPERSAAVLAARKKFIISRLGDLALLVGIILTALEFKSLEFETVFNLARSLSLQGEGIEISAIGFLFVLGAMTKSAQMPFHFWLPETMETPTPVSALMHAGVINAGGIFVILISPLLQYAEAAHLLLSWLGALTAVFGALVMITQNDIKKKLAYSTISQMGMMMFACGLGAYSLALFHVIAHSFYKAHAFLSTGFLVNESKWAQRGRLSEGLISILIKVSIGCALIASGWLIQDGAFIAYLTYGAVIWLGISQVLAFTSDWSFAFLLRFMTSIVLAIGMWLGLEYWIHLGMVDLVPGAWGEPADKLGTSIGTFLIFVTGYLMSRALVTGMGESKGGRRWFLFFWNGGYFSQWTTGWLRRFV